MPIESGSEFPIAAPFGSPIGYNNETINLVADLAAWAVLASADKFKGFVESA